MHTEVTPALGTDERFRLLVEAVSDYAIFMLDPDGIVTTWNAGAARFKGYTAQEIIGQHFSMFYTEEDRQVGLPLRALNTAVTEGRFEQEGWRVRKDGTRMWAHVVIDPIQTDDGKLIGFAKITRDMTERKAAQDALRSSENRFRLLVQGVTDYAIYMLDPEGRVASWNRGAQRFKGYTEDEILGEHFSRFYTEEDRAVELPRRALETAVREGRFEQEGWRIRKDGTRMWAHVVIDPLYHDDGTLVGYAKITRDLSERKVAREALRLSEERFRLLVQGVSDYAIYMLDTEGRVANWNTGAQRFKGYTEQEILGEHFSRFYTDEDRAAGVPARALATAVNEGRFEQEGWRVRKDGSRFWAHVIIDAIRNDDGTLIGFAKVTRDVTERRAAQEALEQTRAALFQAQKMETVGQLTGGIAHDFNNLLAVVLGNLELMRKRLPDEPKLRTMLDNTVQAAERGVALTRRMLAFARRQELKVEPVQVPNLVRDMSDLVQRSIGPMVHIETRFPLRLAPAFADPSQLELAILNLIVNARDAMPAGGTITVSAREERLSDKPHGLQPGDYICVSVADTGEGMDDATLARAVEPFFTTKGLGKGTGLGLSTIHGFAEQSGGRLFLKSRKGEGTTAEIWLPAARPDPVTLPTEPADEPAIGGGWSGPGLTVLVVDDDSLVLTNTSAMLEDMGHEVIEATSAEQALRALRRARRVDLVITDQLMPGMTGTELLEAIKAEWPHVPVMLASGYAELPPSSDPHLLKLSKPFRQTDLARAIALVMQEDRRVLPFRPRQH
jgi:PAS domain S-box-containing protein